MHSTYVMLAAMKHEPRYLDRAARLWPELEKLLRTRQDGIPRYGEILLEDGSRAAPGYTELAPSCGVWGLTLPNFAPLDDWDTVRLAVLENLRAHPGMHWMNGLAAALAAVDPWVCPPERLLDLHLKIAAETARPGTYLPMGGAMPEKFAAPEGNLYHDIRPQAFAMGAWLGAWTALGLRRLPYGLALRPTTAFECIEAYPWRGSTLEIEFDATGRAVGLEIDGQFIPGTLQLPQDHLKAGQTHTVRLVAAPEPPLLLRSSVQLDEVERSGTETCCRFTAFGTAQMTFSAPLHGFRLTDSTGHPIPCCWTGNQGLHTCHFTHFGTGNIIWQERMSL